MTVAGVVLAAGEGRRFGGPKAVAVFAGERLVDRAVRLAREGGCDLVVVVAGAVPLDVAGAQVVDNRDWASGMGSSLRVGLAALPTAADAALVLLVDTPWLGPESVRRLLAAHRGGARLAVATYDGERGHPILLGRNHWPGVVASAHGDSGARAYLRDRADEVVEVDCTGTGVPTDVDLPSDLAGPRPGPRR